MNILKSKFDKIITIDDVDLKYDPTIGTKINPALSCADIKIYGQANPINSSYYILNNYLTKEGM